MKHLLTLLDLRKQEALKIIDHALKIKKYPKRYATKMYEKSLLMMFEAPSLRTRLSFEVGMTQMGGHAINYYMQHSPWALGKESIEDVARVIPRYCDIAMARLYSHEELEKLAEFSSIPIINAMTNLAHPCQILGDFMTIAERKKDLSKIKLAFLGDGDNNVTNSLLFGGALLGMHVVVACPKGVNFTVQKRVLNAVSAVAEKSKAVIEVTDNPAQAARHADVIYTDTWMSYRIAKGEAKKRVKIFKKYQVTPRIMNLAKPRAMFMHNLPAVREKEVTSSVIDGPKSVVFDQAENRLHIQKAIILYLLGKLK